MIDLQGIFDGLLQFFDKAQNGDREQFITAIVDREIATEGETNVFLNHFLALGVSLAMLNSADFDVLMAKRRAVGLDTAIRAARVIRGKLAEVVEFKIAQLQIGLDQANDYIVLRTTTLANVATARAWIDTNAPAVLKADTLETLDAGTFKVRGQLAAAQRIAAEKTEEIIKLGGVPT